MSRLPNFLYIGTSKAGSTWLYDVLNHHPDVHMARGKGLYFFSAHYDRGLGWYRAHFSGAGDERVVGEVSHTYLYAPRACGRIAATLPDVRLMVCLREPAERAFSEYLDLVKNGYVTGSFETQLERMPRLVEWGRYAKYLAPYLERFGLERLHVAVFDELAADPDAFARKVFEFLEVEPIALSIRQRERMQPAGEPRWRIVSQLAKRASHTAKVVGLRGLRGRVKTSRRVRTLLYRPYTPERKPAMQAATRERMRQYFGPEVERLDGLLGTGLCGLWGYE